MRRSAGELRPAVLVLLLALGVAPAAAQPAASPIDGRTEPAGSQQPVTAVDDAPWWQRVVFYEIFVRSFADASRGPLADDGIGDLQGLIERLDYLNDGVPGSGDDLEIGGLWLMPIMDSPSYHGYDVRDYRTVERDYGTRQDFARLIDEAHRRGVRVILDLVINHTSRQHRWFRDAYRRRSPYHGWYRWADEPHDYLGPWGQRVWHQLAWWQRGWQHFDYLAYYGVFSPHMPDLDLRHPQATQAIHAVARFWLEEMRADGFRLDAARHLVEDGTVQEDTAATHDWLRRFFAVVKATAPDAVLVGEIWAESEIVATYGPDQVDLTFQFDLATAIVEAVRDRRADGLARALQAIQLGFSSGRFATFLSNHDQVRVLTQLAGDRDGARLAASLLLTLPGVPFIYYGEEIGMVGSKPDPRIRTPMQWTSGRHAGFSSHRPWQRLQLGHDTTNVENELADPGSLLHHYRRLIRLRNARPSLHLGTYRPIATGSAQLFAFLRRAGAEATLVVVHLGDEPLADYRLDVGPSDLTGAAAADLASGLALPPLAATGYRPIDRLAPHTAYLIALGPGE